MPVPGFLASFADKAQSAIASLPSSTHRPASPDAAHQPSANESAAQSSHKSHALESIQYQLRAFGQQYTSSTSPVQKIITAEKGLAIDFDSVASDSKFQSKELYTWGQTENDDLKDVTDRLAYINFVQGSLASSLALKLDAARAPLKALRDAETSLAPRRNIRAGFRAQLTRIEHDQQRGMEKKIAELKDQLRKAESDDLPQEREVELLKRKGIRESEQLKWEALREYGEKLVLLSQAATPIIAALPTLPPTPTNPYVGAQTTGAARASLQRALDNYKTGHINLPSQGTGADLKRSDTLSFGESHASELSSLSSASEAKLSGISNLPASPSIQPKPLPATSHPYVGDSIPINPSTLNNTPTPLPGIGQTGMSPNLGSGLADSQNSPLGPTVAETGVPVVAGEKGPGPSSGSLHDLKAHNEESTNVKAGFPSGVTQPQVDRPSAFAQAVPTQAFPTTELPVHQSTPAYESAAAEKQRLQAQYSQVQQSTPSYGAGSSSLDTTTAPKHESAEEEKRRLEREERDKLLKAGGHPTEGEKKNDDDLPPYQDY